MIDILVALSGINLLAILGVAFRAGRLVEKVDYLQDQVDRLLEQCPYCQVGGKDE